MVNLHVLLMVVSLYDDFSILVHYILIFSFPFDTILGKGSHVRSKSILLKLPVLYAAMAAGLLAHV